MSNMVFCNEYKPYALDALISAHGANWQWGCFVNNYVPVPGGNLAALVEPTDSGYARKTGIVLPATGLVGNRGVSQAAGIQTWTFTHSAGDFTIYGLFIYDVSLGKTVAIQQVTPTLVNAAGFPYAFRPRMEDDSIP